MFFDNAKAKYSSSFGSGQISFALFNKLSYVLWKIRNRDPESYPIWKSDLTKMAEKFNLKILSKKRLTPLIGLECVIYFQKK